MRSREGPGRGSTCLCSHFCLQKQDSNCRNAKHGFKIVFYKLLGDISPLFIAQSIILLLMLISHQSHHRLLMQT